jgi:hypothetical protein
MWNSGWLAVTCGAVPDTDFKIAMFGRFKELKNQDEDGFHEVLKTIKNSIKWKLWKS